MKKLILLVMAILPMIAGCGGGGGGDNAAPLPTAATLKLSSQGTMPVGKAVSGIDVTIELPAGATVKTTSGVVDATVVVASGLLTTATSSMSPITYTPAAGATKAKLDFTIASTALAGVQVGEYATITLILSGVNPAVTDFNATLFKAYAVDGSGAISALTPKLALTVN